MVDKYVARYGKRRVLNGDELIIACMTSLEAVHVMTTKPIEYMFALQFVLCVFYCCFMNIVLCRLSHTLPWLGSGIKDSRATGGFLKRQLCIGCTGGSLALPYLFIFNTE